MIERAFEHPVLGQVRWDDGVSSWEAVVELPVGNSITLSIVAEGEWADSGPAELFEIGVEYLAWAREAEPTVRARVADDLLDCYNEVWADEDPEEGTPPMYR